jgi:16S rRNA (guanine1207-N2)-methyltransferase
MTKIASILLQQHVEISGGQHVLTLGVAPELAADWAARVGTGQVWAASDDFLAVQATGRLAQQKQLDTLHPLLAADLSELPTLPLDVCVVDILDYPSRAYLHCLLSEAAQHLKSGGRLYIAGANDEGIRSLEKRLRAAWGTVNAIAYKKGHRVLLIPKRADLPPLEHGTREEVAVELCHQKFRLVDRPGVFASGLLDDATRLLAESIEVTASDQTLDLGCGSGILGMLAARLAPQGEVYLVDSSAIALASAQEHCRLNHLTNVHILTSDGVSAVREQRFDLVLCNPPFHTRRTQSSATALRFIQEVGTILAPRGRFYLVANQFLRYEPIMRETFGNVTTLANDGRYKVLLSEQMPAR